MDRSEREKRFFSLAQRAALCLALLLVSGVCFLFAGRKSGMFIDEIYTYGLSNGHYTPFIKGLTDDQLLTRQEVLSYLTVDPGEGFDLASVYDNQVQDVHPPLYYWLFNMVSSLTPGVFSKWTGLILDYLIYMAALLLLYRLCRRLFGSRFLAAAAAGLYGLSVIGMSTMLMIRMYVLLTALSLTLACLAARLLEERRLRLCPWIGLAIFLGLMTQYYFVFYAFFLCGFLLLWALCTKQFKLAGVFTLCSFGGVALLLLAFPACLDQLFADALVSGGNALENLAAFSAYSGRLLLFIREVAHRMKAAVYLTMAAAVGLLLCFRRVREAAKAGKLRFSALLVILPAFPAFFLVAVISPVTEIRYVYNLAPFFVLAVCFLLHVLERSLEGLRLAEPGRAAAFLLILALALWEARCLPPDYLYPEHADYHAALSAYSGSPCIYLTGYNGPLTQDALFLLDFDRTFVTTDPADPALAEYLASFGQARDCVVFVDVDSFWSSGFDPEEMLPRLLEATPFQTCEQLYSYALTKTYVLTA